MTSRALRSLFPALAAIPFIGATGTAIAQAPPTPNTFRYGMSYDFEVTSATRVVNDAHDQGPISLTVYIWRPLHTESNKVIFFSHGSTGAGSIHPKEPLEPIPRPLVRYFVERGYTLVMPMRRGVGSSTGKFVAECQFQSGACSLADTRALAGPSLDDAVMDNSAVLDQVVLGRMIPRNAKVLFAGISRGGFLSLRMASVRPESAAGVLNFVGGWISMTDAWPAEENKARLELHQQWLREMAGGIKAPTLWIYASRDPFYSEVTTRSMFDTFIKSGGKGKYVFVSDHSLPTGHSVGQAPELWGREADEFVASLE
ncbi:MAG: alpha/beta hydrolase [Gammaproteobacteria bacterium]|jgi:pimeloyl-ACP methyl ester carboxylesterase|nr:alpha/beta hydrolase [Gammaproteobacteria bacterium]MDH5226846.1 alpha/beta hydrolase [Gammaproteobacteria bacterium]